MSHGTEASDGTTFFWMTGPDSMTTWFDLIATDETCTLTAYGPSGSFHLDGSINVGVMVTMPIAETIELRDLLNDVLRRFPEDDLADAFTDDDLLAFLRAEETTQAMPCVCCGNGAWLPLTILLAWRGPGSRKLRWRG